MPGENETVWDKIKYLVIGLAIIALAWGSLYAWKESDKNKDGHAGRYKNGLIGAGAVSALVVLVAGVMTFGPKKSAADNAAYEKVWESTGQA